MDDAEKYRIIIDCAPEAVKHHGSLGVDIIAGKGIFVHITVLHDGPYIEYIFGFFRSAHTYIPPCRSGFQ